VDREVVAVCVVAPFFLGFPNGPGHQQREQPTTWPRLSRRPVTPLPRMSRLPVLAVAAAALARQDLRRLRHLAVWAAVVSLLSLNYSVDLLGLQMNVSADPALPGATGVHARPAAMSE
jgi:hypothetical protein